MLQPVLKEGILTCANCDSHQFWVEFKEIVSHRLNTAEGKEGWGETELIESDGPDLILAVVCYECDNDIEITQEVVDYIRRLGG